MSAAVILAALTACSGPAREQPPVDASPRARLTPGCEWVAEASERLWDPMLRGDAGYGEPLNLAARPSLYWTSWSLRLAAEVGESRPTVPVSRIRRFLVSSFQKASTQDEQISPLLRVSLATGGLAALPHGMTRREKLEVGRLVEGMRQGSGYAWSTAGRVDPAATMIAIAALRDAGLPVPDPVVGAVQRGADRVLVSNVSDEDITTSGIPRIVALVLSGDELSSKQRAGVRRLVDDWRARILGHGAGAVQISALYWLDVVGSEVGAPSAAIPADWLEELITPSGYVEAQPGAGGDAQSTYYVAHLGALDGPSVARSLVRRLGEQGWIATVSKVDLTATSHIVNALRLCGALDRVAFPSAALPRSGRLPASIDARSAGQVCTILAAFPREAEEWTNGEEVECDSTTEELRRWWGAQADANLMGSLLGAEADASSSSHDDFCREDLCWFLNSGKYSDRDVYSTAIHATVQGFDAERRARLLQQFARGSSYSTNPQDEAEHQVDSLTILGVALLAAQDLASLDTLAVV